MIKIAIFASGSGSNAQNIIEHFGKSEKVCISLVVSNKPGAFVLERAKAAGVETRVFSKAQFMEYAEVLKTLKERKIDFIVLAGFLLQLPAAFISAYKNRIINIHPALLPSFGGKGMYGARVHEAVIASGEKESGITIHYVDEEYDHGSIIFQARCPVVSSDTPETLAKKVHELEYRYFPSVIGKIVSGLGNGNPAADLSTD